MARVSAPPSPKASRPRLSWPPRSQVGHPHPFATTTWRHTAARNRAVLAQLRPIASATPKARRPAALRANDLEALDTALTGIIQRLTAHWGALGPYVRVVATPVAASPIQHTPSQVDVPLLLWASHRPITVKREARLREYLIRSWSHQDIWRSAIRRAGDYRLVEPPLKLWEPLPPVEQWLTPNGVWPHIMKHSVIRLLWARWTPQAGWVLRPFLVHGRLVPHPTRQDVQEFARIILAADTPDPTSVPMPVNRSYPILVQWNVFLGAALILLWILRTHGFWVWAAAVPPALGLAITITPPLVYRHTYRRWQRWCDRHWLLHS